MGTPTTNTEKELFNRGYRNIVGLDEAGRGAWAGPVVAASLRFDGQAPKIAGVNDSKLLSRRQRDYYYDWLTNNFNYGVGVVSHELIDIIGIGQAIKLAMLQAIGGLSAPPDYLLTDAVRFEDTLDISQENIVHGDQKIWTIAAASIIAKVTRDRLMAHYHEAFSVYGFDRHQGYGTRLHQTMISLHGLCRLHRRSYKPIRRLITR